MRVRCGDSSACSRISRSTRLRETRTPSRVRSRAQTLRCPSPVQGERARSALMAWSKAASEMAGFGRFCQNSRQTRRREVKAEFSLRCFENSEHTASTTQVKQATAAGGDVLVVVGAGAEEVAELVVASTEPLR